MCSSVLGLNKALTQTEPVFPRLVHNLSSSRNYPSAGQPMEDDSNVLPVPYHVVQSGTPGACYIADAVWQSQCVDDTSQHHLAEVS